MCPLLSLELNVFCGEVIGDLLLLNLANLSKLGEEMYSLNRWQISSCRSKLALCFIRRLLNKTWNFVTVINPICGLTDEVLSSMSSFNSLSLLTQLSESKVKATKSLIVLYLHIHPRMIGSSLIVATQLFLLQEWNLTAED